MEDFEKKYGLDMHCAMILEEYQENLPVLEKMKEIVVDALTKRINDNGIYINALEARIKTEKSLAGKLELKGNKYGSLMDLTDILGARIITFYQDEVDKVSALVDRIFTVDWKNSVDKRKMHDLSSFGYNSLHFICTIPEKLYCDPAHPEINQFRFEIQMRTALQHAWATMNHDTGYKTGVEVPVEYLRNMNRLAGMLELADEQFCIIRTSINDYRREVEKLVAGGKFDEVPLDCDTFRSYLNLMPFAKLTKKIAAINQAEIHVVSLLPYLEVLHALGFKTLGDVQNLINKYSDDAYELAIYELADTDLDIISSTIALQDLLVVYILDTGGGEKGLEEMFDHLNGPSSYNKSRAQRIMHQAAGLKFMNK